MSREEIIAKRELLNFFIEECNIEGMRNMFEDAALDKCIIYEKCDELEAFGDTIINNKLQEVKDEMSLLFNKVDKIFAEYANTKRTEFINLIMFAKISGDGQTTTNEEINNIFRTLFGTKHESLLEMYNQI